MNTQKKELTKVLLGKDGQIYCSETGTTIAVIPYYNHDSKELRYFQRLLAAAPQLYSALVKVMAELDEEKRRQQILTLSKAERDAECLIFNIDNDEVYTI